ncbi:MAG: hypothetical protein ACXVDN_23140 [Ktedonobacteraceae bacterium]
MRQLLALLSFWQNSSASDLSWEAHVGEKVNLQSRRALLKQFAPQYCEASYAQKRVLLDVFAQATGYHRGSGMWLLNHAEDVLHEPAYKRSNHYGSEVQHALERHEHLQVTAECRSQLL